MWWYKILSTCVTHKYIYIQTFTGKIEAHVPSPNLIDYNSQVLNQFSQIPKLYHTAEFECFEAAARENIEREICTLREHLLTGQHE